MGQCALRNWLNNRFIRTKAGKLVQTKFVDIHETRILTLTVYSFVPVVLIDFKMTVLKVVCMLSLLAREMTSTVPRLSVVSCILLCGGYQGPSPFVE